MYTSYMHTRNPNQNNGVHTCHICLGPTQDSVVQALVEMRLPPAPGDHLKYKPDKAEAAPTETNGIGFRFTRRRPPKVPVSRPEDPHSSTTTDNSDPIPRHWQRHITADTSFSSSLNLDWLRAAAMANISDPSLRRHVVHTYTYGGDDHCDLPPHAQRFHAKNSVHPGSEYGDAWDDLLDDLDARGRLIERDLPVYAGTVVNPMGADSKIKVGADGAETTKYRPYIDGRATRHEGRNLGDWCHPRNRQYRADNIHDTITMLIDADAAAVNVHDYKGFHTYMPRRIETVPRNCICWRRRGADHPTYIYIKDDVFGQVPTPAKVERHACLLQTVQEQRISDLLGRPLKITRRTDDSLIALKAAEHPRADEVADVFRSVCDDAGQPIQRKKDVIAATKFKFDGYWFDLGHHPDNRHGGHPGAIGIDAGEARKILHQLTDAIKGTDRKHIEQLVGVLEWVAAVHPHLRALINTVRRAMYAVKADNDPVTGDAETTADLQRLTRHFQPGPPKMVPFYRLYLLTDPEIDMWTDASGTDGCGGYMDGMFWTEPLLESQRLDAEMMARDEGDEELSLCTGYLELLALYYMVLTAGHRLRHKIVRWTTDATVAANAWTKQSSKHHASNRLLAALGDHCTTHGILIQSRWWPREQNHLADSLTHADTSTFCRLARTSPREQVRVPRRAIKRAVGFHTR